MNTQEALDESLVDDDGTLHEGTTAAIAAATMDDSSETTEDHLLNSLQSSMMLRKNLEQEFQTTVTDKIEYFESETKKHVIPFPALSAPKPGKESMAIARPHQCPRFQVFLRVRPSTDDTNTIEIIDGTTVRTNPPRSSYTGLPKEYTYDCVLAPSLTQKEVYDQTAAPLLARLFQGSSVLLFCYGVTNAGKTFTLHGEGNRISGSTTTTTVDTATAPEPSWGVLPRVLHDTFIRVKSYPTASKELHVAFFELYQERFYDLLQDDLHSHNSSNRRKALRLREDKVHGHAFIEGLSTHKVESIGQALHWMKIAKKNRQTATNDLNQSSSRSHCVSQLIVKDVNTHETASFWVVDLAGSERNKRTASAGLMRHQEACSINKSLMTLMRCLMTLKDESNNNNKVAPFRESKLTHLLMPHWSASSNTVTAMVVNINPSACDYDESQHVLSYATQAKTIQLPIIAPRDDKPQTNRVEYDENGRRKRATGGVRAKVGQLLQKLSPKRVGDGYKRKASELHNPDATKVAAGPFNNAHKRLKGVPSKATFASSATGKQNMAKKEISKSVKPNAPSSNIKSSKAYKALQMELTVARTEASFLKAEKRELEEQLECLEDQVRKEMAEDMDQHMRNMRLHYEDIIQNLQKQKLNFSSMKATPHRCSAAEKIEQLEEQVQECEEEMVRQREEHARELESVKNDYEHKMSEAVKEAIFKETALLRTECQKKQELIDNYRRLLQEEEDDLDDEEPVSDEESIRDDDDALEKEEDELDDEEPVSDEETIRDDDDALEKGDVEDGEELSDNESFEKPSPDESFDDTSEKSFAVATNHEHDDDSSEEDEETKESCQMGMTDSLSASNEQMLITSHDVNANLAAEHDNARDDEILNEPCANKRHMACSAAVHQPCKNGSIGNGNDLSHGQFAAGKKKIFEGAESPAEDEEKRPQSCRDTPEVADYPSDRKEVPIRSIETDKTGVICVTIRNEAEDARDSPVSKIARNSSLDSPGRGILVSRHAIGKENTASVDVMISSCKKIGHRTSVAKSTKLNSTRKPLALAENKRDTTFGDVVEKSPGMWLTPKKEAKKHPQTGMYQRPRGRPPVGTEGWDERKGKWRLSAA